ncbi:hypothetical protein, partial [Rothia sp. HMSC065G12]|uniref:hypothetical protein n=1 Tax=Rothia sp. HMSC065G12 TaxID=1739308 RepID=UPI001AF0020B
GEDEKPSVLEGVGLETAHELNTEPATKPQPPVNINRRDNPPIILPFIAAKSARQQPKPYTIE